MSELRDFLKEKLPDYMVPSAFVFLDSLPLTPNGKLDRKALPPSDQTKPTLDKSLIMPRDALELDLAKIWEKTLAIRPVGVRDNFFEIGGHSLLVVRLFAEIEKTVGRRLPLATIFQAPTIEKLAAILRAEEWSGSYSSLWSAYPSSVVPFHPTGFKPPLFWFNGGPWDVLLPRYLGSDQPVYGLQHQSQDGHRALYTSIEDMAAYYISEIRTVQAKGPYFLAGFCIGGMVAFEMAQQLKKQGDDVALLVLIDPTIPRSGKLSSVHKEGPTLSSQLTWLCNKAYHHFRELALLSPPEQLRYILVRVQDRKMQLQDTIRWKGMKILCETFGCPLPSSMRGQYITSIYLQATQSYVPQRYRGRVMLYNSQTRYLAGHSP